MDKYNSNLVDNNQKIVDLWLKFMDKSKKDREYAKYKVSALIKKRQFLVD